MLAFKLDNKFVDLPNDFSVTMNLKSPIFGDVGSYSYPFKIPASPRNDIILNFGRKVENTTDPYLIRQGEFTWNGLGLFSGTSKLKLLSKAGYEGTLFEGEGDFRYRRKNLSMQQVDLGELTFADEIARLRYIAGCSEKFYPDRNIAFPMIWNPNYFDPVTTIDDLKWLNYYQDGVINMTASGPILDRIVIIPMLFLRFVLVKIFEKLGYILDDSFFATDNDFNSCLIYNSVDCNEDISGVFTYPLDKILLNYHMPRVTLNEFFVGLEDFFNIRLFVNNRTKTVRIISIDDIIKNLSYQPFPNKVISISTELEDKVSGFSLSMEIDSDDSNIQWLGNFDNARIENIKDAVQDFSDLPVWPAADEDETRYVINDQNFYRMTSGAWVLFDINSIITYTKYLYKMTGGEEINTKVSTLSDYGSDYVECSNKRDNWKANPMRLFFLKTVMDEGFFYSMAGNSYTATRSLFYYGAKGLFNRQYRSFLDFRISTKLVRITIQLGYIDLVDFDFSRKYMFNGIKYLVKSLQVTIKRDRIMPAVLECYPCN
jgi:hypothetical protein